MRLIGAVLVVLAACGGEAPPEPARRACSAEGMSVPRGSDDVPRGVAATRGRIIDAAVACDYAELERVALAGSPVFNYSFGQPNERSQAKPGSYWREREGAGEPALRVLVRLFGLPHARTTIDEPIYVWPSAAGEAPSSDDWTAVEKEFGRDTVAGWRTPEGYLGPRVGITTAGDWIFYVAGD